MVPEIEISTIFKQLGIPAEFFEKLKEKNLHKPEVFWAFNDRDFDTQFEGILYGKKMKLKTRFNSLIEKLKKKKEKEKEEK